MEMVELSGSFFNGNGHTVTLSEVGHLGLIINHVRDIIFPRVESQISQKARTIQSGKIVDSFKRSYDFSEVSFVHGDSIISGKIEGQVIKKENYLFIQANVEYQFYDEFTDPASLREREKGTSSKEGVTKEEIKRTELGGNAYLIVDRWLTKLTAIIPVKPK